MATRVYKHPNPLPIINIIGIGAIPFRRHIGNRNIEVFTISIYEIDYIIKEREAANELEAKLLTEEENLQKTILKE